MTGSRFSGHGARARGSLAGILVLLLAQGAGAPVLGGESSSDFDYIKPLLGSGIPLPGEVLMLRAESVKFRDPTSAATKSALLAQGGAYSLARLDGLKALLVFRYQDTVVGGYSLEGSVSLKAGPARELKGVTNSVEVAVPAEATDLADRLIATLEHPPSVTLRRDVKLSIFVNGKEVGKQPVKAGQSVDVVDFREGAALMGVSYKGAARGTIEIAATEWDAALAELKRRRGAVQPPAANAGETPLQDLSSPETLGAGSRGRSILERGSSRARSRGF